MLRLSTKARPPTMNNGVPAGEPCTTGMEASSGKKWGGVLNSLCMIFF